MSRKAKLATRGWETRMTRRYAPRPVGRRRARGDVVSADCAGLGSNPKVLILVSPTRPQKRAPNGALFRCLAGRQGLIRRFRGSPCGQRRFAPLSGRLAERASRSNLKVLILVSLTRPQKRAPNGALFRCLAGRQGFEPWLAESESAVLPLDDLPIRVSYACD